MNTIDTGPAKIIAIGVAVCSKFSKHCLKLWNREATWSRNSQKLVFLKSRKYLVTNYTTKYIYRNQITKKSPRSNEDCNEDFSAFGLLVEKFISKEQAFQYSMTTLPPSLTDLYASLRRQKKRKNKSNICNQIMKIFHYLNQIQ